MIDFSKIQVQANPRKVSRTTPNLANRVEAAFKTARDFPELVHPHVWLTGSRVWRLVLGEEVPEGADLDVFVTDLQTYADLVTTMYTRINAQGGSVADRPAENRSHARGVGMKFTTADGHSIDVWHEATDPFYQLELYPADGYAHCRAAYNLARRALIVMPNDCLIVTVGKDEAALELACVARESHWVRFRRWLANKVAP